MRINHLLVPFLFLLVIVSSSCLSTTDPLAQYADWKLQNETYINTIKSNADYTPITIPVNRGGGVFYSKITKASDLDGSPLYNDTVIVHYRGKLYNGTVFDQTYAGTVPDLDKNEKPRSFSVNAVIKGWTEALMLMRVGEKRTIVLPYQLGYGEVGSGSISPYSTLIFDVELVSYGTPKNK